MLRRLRGCESGGRYATATGNGYCGGYQFSAAAARVQDAAAARLWSLAGAAPWGTCGRAAARG